MVEVRDWYFAVNANGIDHYEPHIRLAVSSFIRAQSNWDMHCIYDGPEGHTLIAWLHSQGVQVHLKQSRWKDQFPDASGKTANLFNPSVATGAYLRLEVPQLASRRYVLYTDVDVYFRHALDFAGFALTQAFACALEFAIVDSKAIRYKGAFNSGVMLLDTEAMRTELEEFSAFVLAKNFDFQAYDQGALNEFFQDRWDALPAEYNTRIFGEDWHGARIVHFHGPKLGDVIAARNGGPEVIGNASYRALYSMNPEGYDSIISEILTGYPEIAGTSGAPADAGGANI